MLAGVAHCVINMNNKYSLALVLVFAVFGRASLASAGCPQVHGTGSVSDEQVTQFLTEIRLLSDAAEKNRKVYHCFKDAQDGLSWAQAKALASAAQDTGYDSTRFEQSSVRNAIYSEYFEANITSWKAEEVPGIANLLTVATERDKLIDHFHRENLSNLSWPQTQALLAGLTDTGYDTGRFTITKVAFRMKNRFYEARKTVMPPELAIQVARAFGGEANMNEVIEDYFRANIETLTWPQVESLIASLAPNTYGGRHTGEETRDRMLRKWQRQR